MKILLPAPFATDVPPKCHKWGRYKQNFLLAAMFCTPLSNGGVTLSF